MTILYALHTTDPLGGSTKSFLILLKGVLDAKHKAIVVVPDTEGIYATLVEMGVEVIVQDCKENTWTSAWNLRQTLLFVPRQMGRMYINHRACRSLKKKLMGRNIDIVHSNSSVTPLGRYIATEFNLPHLVHIREYGNKDFGLTYFPTNNSYYEYLKTNGVFTACITKDIQRHFGLSSHPASKVIYNGIIADMPQLPSDTKPRSFLLYAGRIDKTKGLKELIEAYAIYKARVDVPLPLKVAGEELDKLYADGIRNYIHSNGLSANVEFLGKVKDMATLYTEAKAVVIPSYFEGFGRCMPEAMSYGCIAIGRNTGGTKEQLDNGMTLTGHEIGFRFSTTQEMAECLIRLHNSSDSELSALRQRALGCVQKLYSAETYIKGVIEYYEWIMENA